MGDVVIKCNVNRENKFRSANEVNYELDYDTLLNGVIITQNYSTTLTDERIIT